MIALALVHIMWGGAFIVLKISQEYLSNSQILFGRVFFASLIYIFIWRWIPKPKYQKGDWKLLALVALCEPFLLFAFETFGLEYTSASQGGMIVACVPLVVAAGAYLVYKERLNRNSIIGIAMALIGVLIVSSLSEADNSASNPLLGNLLIFCAVLSSTCYALTIKHLISRYHFMYLSAIQVFGATILFTPVALISSGIPTELPWQPLACLLYLSIGVTFLVYFVINYALSKIKAAQVMMFSNLIPVSTLIFAFIFLGEKLSMIQYGGATLVLAGVILAGLSETND